SCPDAGVRRPLPGAQTARLPLRRADHRLCAHVGDRDGRSASRRKPPPRVLRPVAPRRHPPLTAGNPFVPANRIAERGGVEPDGTGCTCKGFGNLLPPRRSLLQHARWPFGSGLVGVERGTSLTP